MTRRRIFIGDESYGVANVIDDVVDVDDVDDDVVDNLKKEIRVLR